MQVVMITYSASVAPDYDTQSYDYYNSSGLTQNFLQIESTCFKYLTGTGISTALCLSKYVLFLVETTQWYWWDLNLVI